MESGYYWAVLDDGDPCIVEIDGDDMYIFGDDIALHRTDGEWRYLNRPTKVTFLGNRLLPPNYKSVSK